MIYTYMDISNEAQVLTNIRLSTTQKFILTKLALPNETAVVSYNRISSGRNLVANRDVLVKLGLIQINNNEAVITNKGKQALGDEGLTDNGVLTKIGNEYAYADTVVDAGKLAINDPAPIEPTTEFKKEPPPGEGVTPSISAAYQPDGEASPSFESWEMIANSQEVLFRKEFLRKHKK